MEEDRKIRTIEIEAPRKARLVASKLTALDDPVQPSVTVRTMYSAVSPGTELLLYNNNMPSDISMDANITSFQTTFKYPCRYGYCAAGIVDQSSAADDFPRGTKVFAFREHTSAFQALPAHLHRIPDNVPLADAALVPTFETALSLIMDANPLPGDTVCVIGQGLVGLTVAACLRKLYPYNLVATVEPRESRRKLSTTAANVHLAAASAQQLLTKLGEPHAPDVSIEVSGVEGGLDTALTVTRDYGRIVLGSWFGSKPVTLHNLGGHFHRSHVSIIASQVSDVPASIAPRWSKNRRFQLAWKLIADIAPGKTFNLPHVSPEDCAEVYAKLAMGDIVGAIFAW